MKHDLAMAMAEALRQERRRTVDGCFLAALLLCAGIFFLAKERDETALLAAAVMGLLVILLGLVLLVKLAIVRGLLVIVFVGAMAMGVQSSLKFERMVGEAAEFDEQLRQMGVVPAGEAEAAAQADAEKKEAERAEKLAGARAALEGKSLEEIEGTHGKAQSMDKATGWAVWRNFRAKFANGRVVAVELP